MERLLIDDFSPEYLEAAARDQEIDRHLKNPNLYKGSSRVKPPTFVTPISDEEVDLLLDPFIELRGDLLEECAQVKMLNHRQEVGLAIAVDTGKKASHQLESALKPGADLSDERRSELENQIRRGQLARERLFVSNIGLVTKAVLEQYPPNNPLFKDKVAAGCIGLTTAIERFDHRRGFRLSTYSYFWIKQAISRHHFSEPTSWSLEQDHQGFQLLQSIPNLSDDPDEIPGLIRETDVQGLGEAIKEFLKVSGVTDAVDIDIFYKRHMYEMSLSEIRASLDNLFSKQGVKNQLTRIKKLVEQGKIDHPELAAKLKSFL